MKKRIVVEMETTNDEITEGSCKRFVEKIMLAVHPKTIHLHGVIPSSIKVKQYSRVCAAEFGAIVEFDEC